MDSDGPEKCRGCGTNLTVLNRSLDMSGYCGKCATKAQDEGDLTELPADVHVMDIANAGLRADAIRFTLIAIVATVGCFTGAIVGAAVSDPMGRVESSLRASWLFGIVAMFLGKLVFLRKGSVLTFARWKMFWGWFIIFYFLTYIPLALALPGVDELPLPADILTFVFACAVAYLAGILSVLVKDRSLKTWLCERCVLPSAMVDAACRDDWTEAKQMIDETVAQSQSLMSADNMLARLYLASGAERLKAGDAETALGSFSDASQISGVSDAVRFRIACALDDAGNHSDASELLSDLVSSSRDKDVASRARKLIRTIRKRNKLNIRCPKCGRALSGTTDMIGDEAVCAKCKTEFIICEDPVTR